MELTVITQDIQTQLLNKNKSWVFDLDNTLYPSKCNLFAEVSQRMRKFIIENLNLEDEQAAQLQAKYFEEYGTTLKGLMLHHDMCPDKFLDYVHDIDYSPVQHDPKLDAALTRMTGRKVIHTNGTVPHAEAVLGRLGITHHFEGIFDIVASDYIPKPLAAPYDMMLDTHAIDPTSAIMVEDMAKNLVYPAELGMTTVWVRHNLHWSSTGADATYIDHVTDDLSHWLHMLSSD